MPEPSAGHGELRQRRGFFATLKELLFTNREMPGVAPLTAQGVVLASLVGLFAFIGPFATYDTIGHLGRAGYWALALGACRGGNGSVVGASASLTVAAFAEKAKQPIKFMAFMKVAFPVMLGTIAMAHVYLYLRYL